jgi:hypothetical protein
MSNLEGIAMKYLVLKNSDIEEMLTPLEKNQLFNICKEIDFCRATQGLGEADRGKNFNLKPKGKNTYIVINTDEPYTDQIIDIMKTNGHWG